MKTELIREDAEMRARVKKGMEGYEKKEEDKGETKRERLR